MRWMLALLLLMNVALFGWIVVVERRQPTPDPTDTFNESLRPEYRLTLLKEAANLVVRDSSEKPVPVYTQPSPAEALIKPQSQALLAEEEKISAPPPTPAVTQTAPLASATPLPAPQQKNTPPLKDEPPPMSVTFAPQNCFTLGPFEQTKASQRVASLLKEIGITTTQRTTSQLRTSGYWVYLPPFANRQQAQDMAGLLAQKGLKDYSIIYRGEKKNAISLGLFSSLDTVQRRIEQLKELGIAAQFKENQNTSQFFWLDFSSPHEKPIPPAVREKVQKESGGIGFLNRPCS